ncbi:MAG: Trk system potassium transporter TrkA [Erysipelotrichaceae bacterium]|nr:Trk system potassium transporter TrkA [Erysipelotrichaceae bacterium]
MRIVIVGCGKVGATIIEQLAGEGHDIIAIDINSRIIEDITDAYDVMGVVGNGNSYKVLKDAGIEEADLLIAVTDSDLQNLLTCLIAKKAGDCSTIARVRDPELHEEVDFLSEEMGLSMAVNPEKAAAVEIARLIRFPAAIQIDTFSRGEVELMKFIIPENSEIVGCSLNEINRRFQTNVLICCVERKQEALIPDGSFVLQAGDKVSLTSSSRELRRFFKKIGINIKHIRNVMIVGGSRLSVYLCQELADKGMDIKLIEQDYDKCIQLADQLPFVKVICGDGSDESVLKEEGIENCDAFVSLTGIDEENIFMSLFVEKYSNAKVITKADRIAFNDVIESLELGSIIRPKKITAEHIVRYVRGKSNAQGNSQIETMHELIKDKVEACGFNIGNETELINRPLQDVALKKNVLIACIRRGKEIIIPNGQTEIKEGDDIVVVTTEMGTKNIADILRHEGTAA